MNPKKLNVFGRYLSMNDRADVENLLLEFVENEVIAKYMELTSEDKCIYVRTYVDQVLSQGISYGVFDKANGVLCACMLNSFSKRSVTPADYGSLGEMSLKMQYLTRFDDYMEEGIQAALGSDNFILMEIGMVSPSYQKHRLFDKLYLGTKEAAIKYGCNGLVNVSNSLYSIKVSERWDFLPVKKVFFKDYCDPVTGEKIFADIPQPHTHAVLFVKKFQCAKL
ncbi:unnamed protein product [Clavelina lepadiformis]|uniref:N-acetyltransferase domain-containing protein n=1 Tax=Clavelina lepadiformis TaxID=159417 RepID=A0ABP0H2K0_CLALP